MVIAITNIGKIVSGNIDKPLLDGDTIIIVDGKIASVGNKNLLSRYKVEQTVDAGGSTVIPGLIDSHVHPVLGDYSPRQKTVDYMDSSVHGGVTTMISAGEPHVPGRPKDVAGSKALAILACKAYKNFRPNGLKIHGGALILEKGLKEEDFADLAKEGVWLVGEIGLGSVNTPEEAGPMVKWAKSYGMKVAMHTGGTSIPGSSTVTAEMVMKTEPTVVSHANGGPTAVSPEEIDKLIENTNLPLEIVQCGNIKIANYIVKKLNEKHQLDRIIIGNDSPSGSGIIPLGILRTIVQIASLNAIPAETAIAMASGNTAKVYGLNTSMIDVGKEADLVIMDTPMGSIGQNALEAIEAGDIPGVSAVFIDGKLRVNKSRNTPPATRQVEIK
ncbi:MAG TPA: Enamidase [Desulfotomaculum sp.]|nr:MAG: Enamidase [Desulfotomaculum sp. BICA1-6]HBX24214.1 Enamidase [Desulfotomaculum sp.]